MVSMKVRQQVKLTQRRLPRIALTVRRVVIFLSIVSALYLSFLWSKLSQQLEQANENGAQGTANRPSVPTGREPQNPRRRQEVHVQDDAVAISGKDQVVSIAIASTITGCGPEPFTEGAAVLKYAIDQTSVNGPMGGKYDYKFYILYHPNAADCALPLKDLGFVLLERNTPVNVSDIRGDVLRERIVSNGCCGEKELIKLEAYRLLEHPVVIHMDLDVIVLQPMDPVIDFMIDPKTSAKTNYSGVPIMWPEQPVPDEISLVFTKDYNVVAPRRYDKPYQGGFFMIKPNLETYEEFVGIVLEGDYVDEPKRKGWGGKVGPFHGGMTVQGLLPWYFDYLHKGRSVELNRCIYNNMADNPTIEKTVNDEAQGRCRTNQQQCEDCRKTNVSEIVTFHYTVCLKPWLCMPQNLDIVQKRLCHRMHHEWFVYRSNMERSWQRSGTGTGSFHTDHFLGHCSRQGSKGYTPIRMPYGIP